MTRQKKDILRESWVYQEIVEEFFEEGLQEERQRRHQGIHDAIMSLVQTHFSELVALAKQQTDRITDPDVLQKLLLQLVAARSVEEARHILVESVMIESE